MKRRTVKRVLIVTLVPALLVAGAELFLRTRVPHCGTTPFRLSATPGLASEFRPSFTTLYKGVEVSFNIDGYRGPEFPAREEGVLRVALVGDSFTFGTAVDVPDTIAARLERALEDAGVPAQVLNLGVPGYTAMDVAIAMETDALRLEPDVVIYVFFANDVNVPPEYERIDQDATIDGMAGFPLHSAFVQWLNVRVKLAALRWFGEQLARQTPEQSLAQWAEGGGARVTTSIRRMHGLCEERGIRFLVAGYPMLTVVGKNPFRPIDEKVAEVCATFDVEWVDLVDAFGGETDLTRYWASVFDTHPNGEANALVAAHLAGRLSAE